MLGKLRATSPSILQRASSISTILSNRDLSPTDQINSLGEILKNIDDDLSKLTEQKLRVENKIQEIKRQVESTSPSTDRRRKKLKLQQEVEELSKEKEEVSKVIDVGEIISLNVGGVIYCTTKATLLKYPGTMLHSMFSGRHTITKDSEGNYFLDRDGNTFKFILNYLRTGQFPDLTRKELLELRAEAEFFSITPLVRALEKQLESTIIGKFAVLRYNENSNVNNLSWQGMTEPCTLKVGKNLYKCIDDVLTEVDNRGWELMQMGGDGNAEGGWKYVFRKKPNFNGWRGSSNLDRFKSPSTIILERSMHRKHSGSF